MAIPTRKERLGRTEQRAQRGDNSRNREKIEGRERSVLKKKEKKPEG
jgi:hypothetical protein